MTLDDLKTLNVPSISAQDSLLFMWATNPHLDQAIDLGKAWGFAWATVAFVWDKVRVNPGFYTMSQCELCLVFKNRKDPVPARRQKRAPARHRQAEAHSQKPDEVRLRIEEMFPLLRKIELFARESDGLSFTDHQWTKWGFEAHGAETPGVSGKLADRGC